MVTHILFWGRIGAAMRIANSLRWTAMRDEALATLERLADGFALAAAWQRNPVAAPVRARLQQSPPQVSLAGVV